MDELDDLFEGYSDDDKDDNIEVSNSRCRPITSGVLTFHSGTEESLYYYVIKHCEKGNISRILAAIDHYCYTQHWMMHIGDKKLQYLKQAYDDIVDKRYGNISESNSTGLNVVELGSYCGYSAMYFASLMSPSRGDRLYCVECNDNCVKWTQRMIDYAEVGQYVKVLPYKASECVEWSKHIVQFSNNHIDLLLIDHDKASYLSDLKAIESQGLLRRDSIVVADNVLSFGVPLQDYLDYVRTQPADGGKYISSTLNKTLIEYADPSDTTNSSVDGISKDNEDGIEISVYGC